jgi:hypothetical protein
MPWHPRVHQERLPQENVRGRVGHLRKFEEEALYPAYFVDSAGRKLDASKNRYVLRFGPDQLPPASVFWSLTLYELPSSLLSANPLHRYLINSPMLSTLKRDADGGLTLYLQHDSPGGDKEADWLPAPAGHSFPCCGCTGPNPQHWMARGRPRHCSV